MNLRLSTDEIRFRVTKDEALALLEHRELLETLELGPTTHLKLSVHLEDEFVFHNSYSEFQLGLSRNIVEQTANGKSKNELRWSRNWPHADSTLRIVFEVDAFSKKRDNT